MKNSFLTVDSVTTTPVTLGTKNGITVSSYDVYSFPTQNADAYRNEMMHFLDVLNDPSIALKVTKKDAERAIKLAGVCSRSLVSKRAELIDSN